MIAIIDNYDSFTYNLVQLIGGLRLDREIKVVRNDALSVEELASRKPQHIILSPGPCTPDQGGISVEVVRHFAGRVPMLGVCLGHQCIAAAFGAHVVRAKRLMHGKTSRIHHNGEGIYRQLPNPFTATRYHSLIVEADTLPDAFERTAWTSSNELMGIRHKSMAIEGVQFHPESFLTEGGQQLLTNFLMQ